jgi:hypothetical protein
LQHFATSRSLQLAQSHWRSSERKIAIIVGTASSCASRPRGGYPADVCVLLR